LSDFKKTLNPILKQIDETCEIVVVDNSSNLETKRYIEFLNNSVITYIKNDVNRISIARNKGIKSSRGEYIVSIDDDCIPDKTWFKNIKKYCNSADGVMGKVVIPKSTFLGDSISALGFPGGGHIGFEKMWKVDKFGFTSHLGFGNSILKRDVIKKVGYIDENFKYGAEDAEFSHRLVSNGYKIKYCPEIIVFHKPRKSLSEFIKWHVTRGRSNYYLKRKVKNVSGYVALRFWSSCNIFKAYKFKKEIILVPFLLGLSFMLQQYGYVSEKFREEFLWK